MFGENISFERRAEFLLNNVCPLPEEFHLKNTGGANAELIQGFVDLRELLIDIYKDKDHYRGETDLEGYHNLTNTVQFLYNLPKAGILKQAGGRYYYTCDKSELKKFYKNTYQPFKVLEHYDICFTYRKGDKEVAEYRNCQAFEVHFGASDNMALALATLSKSANSVDPKKEYGDGFTMFCRTDYNRMVLNQNSERENVDILQENIIRTTAGKQELYIQLVKKLLPLPLNRLAYLNRYCCPFWNINFMIRKVLVCKTMLFHDFISLAVPLTVGAAQTIISNRKNYPESIQASIEAFGCIQCGKCKDTNRSNLKLVDGIPLCSGRAEARTIYVELNTPEEADCIGDIIKSLTF